MTEILCNGKAADGNPCQNLPMPGGAKCNRCSILHANRNPQARVSAYKLGIWKERVEALSQADALTRMDDEIGILKMSLENVIGTCKDANDIIIHGHRIALLTDKIDKLVNSTHRLQKSSGSLLDKAAILTLAGKIIGVIQKHVSDPETIELIANEIIAEVANMSGLETDERP